MNSDYYTEKQKAYFSGYREDIYNLVKILGHYNNALEVGCGNGGLLAELKNTDLVKYVTGVDPYGKPDNCDLFRAFYNDSIEDVLPRIESDNRFDLIIFADVLEHLADPWTILKQASEELLENNGTVVISIPNFRNVITISKILFGNSFRYEKEGVLDKTHLRFFCKKDIIELVKKAGLEVTLLTHNFRFKTSKFFKINRLKYINLLTLNIIPFWLSDQIIVVAKKTKVIL